eukprot:scaffold196802_cov28-Tisochrysis_lutea.AAC.3
MITSSRCMFATRRSLPCLEARIWAPVFVARFSGGSECRLLPLALAVAYRFSASNRSATCSCVTSRTL